jgi:hypothetical protein
VDGGAGGREGGQLRVKWVDACALSVYVGIVPVDHACSLSYVLVLTYPSPLPRLSLASSPSPVPLFLSPVKWYEVLAYAPVSADYFADPLLKAADVMVRKGAVERAEPGQFIRARVVSRNNLFVQDLRNGLWIRRAALREVEDPEKVQTRVIRWRCVALFLPGGIIPMMRYADVQFMTDRNHPCSWVHVHCPAVLLSSETLSDPNRNRNPIPTATTPLPCRTRLRRLEDREAKNRRLRRFP